MSNTVYVPLGARWIPTKPKIDDTGKHLADIMRERIEKLESEVNRVSLQNYALRMEKEVLVKALQDFPNLRCKSVQKRLATLWGFDPVNCTGAALDAIEAIDAILASHHKAQ